MTKPKGTIVIFDYALPKDKTRRFIIHRLVSLYEHEYYQTFINTDLESLLARTGIVVQSQQSLLFGAARIVKGIKPPETTP